MPLRRRTLCPHNAWTYSRGIAPLTHHQHPRRSQPVVHTPPWRANDLSTFFYWSNYGSRLALRLEITQPIVLLWNYRSKWEPGRIPHLSQSLHQQWCNLVPYFPNIPQRGSIDMIQRTSSIIHRQLWHPCRTFQLSVCKQSVMWPVCYRRKMNHFVSSWAGLDKLLSRSGILTLK